LVEVDDVNAVVTVVKVLLFNVLLPKLGNELLITGVITGTFEVDLSKVNVDVVLGTEDAIFCKDSVLITVDAIDTVFV
jgi:hypothetical protein